jgi:hypothetical protein
MCRYTESRGIYLDVMLGSAQGKRGSLSGESAADDEDA